MRNSESTDFKPLREDEKLCKDYGAPCLAGAVGMLFDKCASTLTPAQLKYLKDGGDEALTALRNIEGLINGLAASVDDGGNVLGYDPTATDTLFTVSRAIAEARTMLELSEAAACQLAKRPAQAA